MSNYLKNKNQCFLIKLLNQTISYGPRLNVCMVYYYYIVKIYCLSYYLGIVLLRGEGHLIIIVH